MPDIRCAWIQEAAEGQKPITHQVTLHDAQQRANGRYGGSEATTDCGIKLTPPTELHTDIPITCQDCLFGVLDDSLREFTREPVLAGGAPLRINPTPNTYVPVPETFR